MSKFKFEQHKKLSGMGVSICPLRSFWTSVYILLIIGTSAASKEKYLIFLLSLSSPFQNGTGSKKNHLKTETEVQLHFCHWSRPF